MVNYKGQTFKKLSETNSEIFGTPSKNTEMKKTSVAVMGAVEQSIGIYQTPSFRDQVTCLWNDPVLKEGITMFSQQVVATGFFLTSNPKYTTKLNGKSALDIIMEWCEVNDIDIKLLEIVIELHAFGNCFYRITNNGFVKIPIESVWHSTKHNKSTALQEKYNIQLVPIYGSEVIPWEEFMHFRIGVTGYHAPFGQGIIYSLLAKPVDSMGNVSPSIYDMRLNMRASLNMGFRKFSFGNEVYSFPSLSNEDFESSGLANKISTMSETGNRIATNSECKIILSVPERTQSYDQFIKQMRDEFFMSLADPSLKLGLEQGFTKATSITASEVYQYKISTMRKQIKEHFEDLFVQILDTMGYKGSEAKVEMNFGPEERADYDIADIFFAVGKDVITRNEARALLSKYHKWDITGDIKNGDKVSSEMMPKLGIGKGTDKENSLPFKPKAGIDKGNRHNTTEMEETEHNTDDTDQGYQNKQEQ